MIIRKTLSAILAVSMLAASGAAFAEEANDIMLISANPEEEIMLISEEETVATEPYAVEYDKAELYGEAKIEEDGLYIVTENGDVQLNVDDNTLFVDGLGFKSSIEAIEAIEFSIALITILRISSVSPLPRRCTKSKICFSVSAKISSVSFFPR